MGFHVIKGSDMNDHSLNNAGTYEQMLASALENLENKGLHLIAVQSSDNTDDRFIFRTDGD